MPDVIPQGDSLSDAELVAGLRRRDPRAFDATYDRYHARIWSYLVRLARSREVAQDLAQETWLSVARRADRLTEDTNLTAWLFTVATNHYRSHRRWSFLHVARHAPMEVEPAATSPGPEGTANARAQVARLEEALGRVAPAHREVLLLTAVEGLETAEVATVLGLREDAVRKRLSRARAELTELLGEDREREPSAPIRGKTEERASRREGTPGDSQA